MGLKENIKSKRLENNLTLEDVAKFIDVSKQTISKYESGIITNIPNDKVEGMAEILGVTPAWLMGWDEKEDSQYVLNMVMKYTKEIDEKTMLELLKKFNKLSNSDRDFALQLIGKMGKEEK